MIDFVEQVPIETTTGAMYNPSKITPEALEQLQYSIKNLVL